MEQGWDPQVKTFFRKILSSLFFGLLWLMTGIMGGIYYQLGSPQGQPLIITILFYTVMAVTLILLVRYLYMTWK